MFSLRPRWLGPTCGLAFAILYVVAYGLMDLPEGGDSDARVVALFSDDATRTAIEIGGVLLVLAGIALLLFLADLRERLDPREPATSIAVVAGVLYVALLIVAAGLQAGYATGVGIGELPEPVDPTLARVLSNTGFWLLLIPGLASAAVLVLASSMRARRAGVLPRALVTAGFVIAPLLLAGALWVPQFLVPLWVLAVSLTLLRTGSELASQHSPAADVGLQALTPRRR